MTGYEMIAQINQMAQCPVKYRANWKSAARKVALQVVTEIERLRAFAEPKAGFVADRSNDTANDLEAKLREALAQFEVKAQRPAPQAQNTKGETDV